mgnify:CR=1 FL=1
MDRPARTTQVLQRHAAWPCAQQSLTAATACAAPPGAPASRRWSASSTCSARELQASQTQDAMVRSEAALQDALEQLPHPAGPARPAEPAGAGGDAAAGRGARTRRSRCRDPAERARDLRLELREARDQVDDAQRTGVHGPPEPASPARPQPGRRALGQGTSFGSALARGRLARERLLTAVLPARALQRSRRTRRWPRSR